MADLHNKDFQLQLKSGLEANINATATVNTAIEGEPHYTTDTKKLYIFDGTNNIPVGITKTLETSTTTASVGDVEVHICNGSSDYVLTLPAHESGRELRIINKNTGVATLTPTSGTIKGSATEVLNQWESIILISDGTNWL